MRAPSLARLQAAFPSLSADDAKLIRALAHAADYRETLASLIEQHCPQTQAYARSCYSDPYASYMWRVTLALHAMDVILGTHGVEALDDDNSMHAPDIEYLNAGDPYVTTLLYHRPVDALRIGCWGDIAEKQLTRQG